MSTDNNNISPEDREAARVLMGAIIDRFTQHLQMAFSFAGKSRIPLQIEIEITLSALIGVVLGGTGSKEETRDRMFEALEATISVLNSPKIVQSKQE